MLFTKNSHPLSKHCTVHHYKCGMCHFPSCNSTAVYISKIKINQYMLVLALITNVSILIKMVFNVLIQ